MWYWKSAQEQAFQDSKLLLPFSEALVHYEADKELTLSCGTPPYGIETVLAHRMEDGSEETTGFVSQTLSSAEHNFSS